MLTNKENSKRSSPFASSEAELDKQFVNYQAQVQAEIIRLSLSLGWFRLPAKYSAWIFTLAPFLKSSESKDTQFYEEYFQCIEALVAVLCRAKKFEPARIYLFQAIQSFKQIRDIDPQYKLLSLKTYILWGHINVVEEWFERNKDALKTKDKKDLSVTTKPTTKWIDNDMRNVDAISTGLDSERKSDFDLYKYGWLVEMKDEMDRFVILTDKFHARDLNDKKPTTLSSSRWSFDELYAQVYTAIIPIIALMKIQEWMNKNKKIDKSVMISFIAEAVHAATNSINGQPHNNEMYSVRATLKLYWANLCESGGPFRQNFLLNATSDFNQAANLHYKTPYPFTFLALTYFQLQQIQKAMANIQYVLLLETTVAEKVLGKEVKNRLLKCLEDCKSQLGKENSGQPLVELQRQSLILTEKVVNLATDINENLSRLDSLKRRLIIGKKIVGSAYTSYVGRIKQDQEELDSMEIKVISDFTYLQILCSDELITFNELLRIFIQNDDSENMLTVRRNIEHRLYFLANLPRLFPRLYELGEYRKGLPSAIPLGRWKSAIESGKTDAVFADIGRNNSVKLTEHEYDLLIRMLRKNIPLEIPKRETEKDSKETKAETNNSASPPAEKKNQSTANPTSTPAIVSSENILSIKRDHQKIHVIGENKKTALRNFYGIKEQQKREQQRLKEEEKTQRKVEHTFQLEQKRTAQEIHDTMKDMIHRIEVETRKERLKAKAEEKVVRSTLNNLLATTEEIFSLYDPIPGLKVKLPERAMELACLVKRLDPRTIFYGGALRDPILSMPKKVNDIDCRSAASIDAIFQAISDNLQSGETVTRDSRLGFVKVKLHSGEELSFIHSENLANQTISFVEAVKQDVAEFDFVQNGFIATIPEATNECEIHYPLDWPDIYMVSSVDEMNVKLAELKKTVFSPTIGGNFIFLVANKDSASVYCCSNFSLLTDRIRHLPISMKIKGELRPLFNPNPNDGKIVITRENSVQIKKIAEKLSKILPKNEDNISPAYLRGKVVNRLKFRALNHIEPIQNPSVSFSIHEEKEAKSDRPDRAIRMLRVINATTSLGYPDISDDVKMAIQKNRSSFQQLVEKYPSMVNKWMKTLLCDAYPADMTRNIKLLISEELLFDAFISRNNSGLMGRDSVFSKAFSEGQNWFNQAIAQESKNLNYVYALFIKCIDMHAHGDTEAISFHNKATQDRILKIINRYPLLRENFLDQNGDIKPVARLQENLAKAYSNWKKYRTASGNVANAPTPFFAHPELHSTTGLNSLNSFKSKNKP